MQAARIAEQESNPPAAIAAQRRVDKPKNNIERLGPRVEGYTEQRDELDKAITEGNQFLVEACAELEQNAKVPHGIHL